MQAVVEIDPSMIVQSVHDDWGEGPEGKDGDWSEKGGWLEGAEVDTGERGVGF